MKMHELLKDVLPKDHSRQVASWYFVDKVLACNNIRNIMDLGCGAGDSIDYFKNKDSKMRWVGVDIELSPEIISREKIDEEFIVYDGVNLPFDDNSFDMVFSNQVFEHVKYPRKLLEEVQRVLVSGGYFVGSTSHLEPYHSYSFWNYTPYGFKILIDEVGMRLKEIRPSIDVFTLLTRRILRDSAFFDRYFKIESPINKLIRLICLIMRKKHDEINLIKLLFCGQFAFLVKKNYEKH